MNDSPTNCEAAAASHDSSPTTTTNLWSIGVWCASATPQDIGKSATELFAAGLKTIRLFVHPDTIVPESCAHISVTVIGKHLPIPAIERLMVAELLMRSPTAGAFLIISANAPTRGIDHWCARADFERAISTDPTLFVDSVKRPERLALPTAAAKAFLADLEGLGNIVCRSESDETFGTSLINWANRTNVALLEIPLTSHNSAPLQDEKTQLGDHRLSKASSATEETIRISGANVSIVVPTWNCADYLSACLRSLLQQTIAAQIIVVDDASTDDTRQILDSLSDRITVIHHTHQRGANAARNTGIRAASGDFIAFADADNEYAPRWIEQLLRAVLANPSAALAYCGYTKQSADRARIENRSAPWDIDTLWFGNYIDMSSVVRRSAIPSEGLHEGFRPFDDWRLWLNMAQRGWQGVWVAEDLFVKHVREASKTEQSLANLYQRGRDIAQVRKEFAGLAGLSRPVSVVIPASGCDDLTARCLAHLGSYCGVPFHVVYVDNGSPVAMLDSVAQAADEADIALRIIRNRENRGFTHAVNQGINASENADVLVLNNDCFIAPGCVENLARELRFNDRVAAAGPLTGDDGHQSLRKPERRALLQQPDDLLEELHDPVRTASRLSQKLRSVAEPVLSFFCALLRREVLQQFGGLDPRFASGLGADDEWCFRVRNHGNEVRVVLNAYAAHLHRSSFERLKIDRDSLQQDAQQLLHRVLVTGDHGHTINDGTRERHGSPTNESARR